MLWKSLLAAALLSVLAPAGPVRSEAAARLDPDAMAVALNTAHPDEAAYITYTVALVDLRVLSRDLVDSAFQWARRKPTRHKKFQYFKHAVIALARRVHLTMPQGTPDLTPTVQGRVVVRLVIDMPVAGAVVRIRGTSRETTTDAAGQFTFENVPYGIHTIDASAVVLLLPKTGSTAVALPNPIPPSAAPGFVTIRFN